MDGSVTVTEQWLIDNSTDGCSWTYAQLSLLGVSIPPAQGWKRSVIGKTITADVAAQFVAAGKVKASAWRRREKSKDAGQRDLF